MLCWFHGTEAIMQRIELLQAPARPAALDVSWLCPGLVPVLVGRGLLWELPARLLRQVTCLKGAPRGCDTKQCPWGSWFGTVRPVCLRPGQMRSVVQDSRAPGPQESSCPGASHYQAPQEVVTENALPQALRWHSHRDPRLPAAGFPRPGMSMGIETRTLALLP